MNLSNLTPAKGSVQLKGKRFGRGQGSGKGGTSTKGHKGQKAISGYSRKIGFEGGQMPLQRRLPKFGFKNPFRKEYKAINLDALDALATQTGVTSIDVQVLIKAGLVQKNSLVKILGDGALTQKLEVKAHAFSKSAKSAIEALEGTAVALENKALETSAE
ncbi:MAG: 50S ribosomal protein L15 [Bacteroidales bacterium]|jgi:large subunit ribosomal protein L15|nr:50S ribosomal protein L15 [Bacteroidales bacterium]